MLLDAHTTLLMTGDSLTDAGRARPVGTLRAGLGNGYPMLVQAMLGAFYPGHAITVINTGIGGNTIRDLDLRWQTDVLDLSPDYVSLMCGVNDVWRQFNIFDSIEKYVPMDEFRSRYTHVIEVTLPKVKSMILLTPYFLESNRGDEVRKRVGEYGAVVKEFASRYQLPCLDTQALLDPFIDRHHSFSLSKDRVHLSMTGHMLLAKAFLSLIGADIFHTA